MTVRFTFAVALICVVSLRADDIEMTRTLTEGNVFCSSKGTYPFQVEVRQVTMDKAARPQSHYFGHHSNPKQYVCSGVSVVLNHRKINVPESAYLDLCYLQAATPPELQENGTWMVILLGGSGGESYKAQLIFDQSKLLERRIIYLMPERKVQEVRKF